MKLLHNSTDIFINQIFKYGSFAILLLIITDNNNIKHYNNII